MPQTITVTLSEEIQLALDDVLQKEGISLNDLIGEAIKEYLFFRRLRLLRERMIAKAQAQGITTEQAVFERVS